MPRSRTCASPCSAAARRSTLALRGIGSLPPAERGPAGKRAERGARRELEGALAARAARARARGAQARLAGERIDVTLPGAIVPHGGLHLLTQVRREIEDIFVGLGYRIAEGPEVELE